MDVESERQRHKAGTYGSLLTHAPHSYGFGYRKFCLLQRARINFSLNIQGGVSYVKN